MLSPNARIRVTPSGRGGGGGSGWTRGAGDRGKGAEVGLDPHDVAVSSAASDATARKTRRVASCGPRKCRSVQPGCVDPPCQPGTLTGPMYTEGTDSTNAIIS